MSYHYQRSDEEPSQPPSENWESISDPNERRRIQNRQAQKRFRDKIKLQKEESDRKAENQRQASSAYTPPEPGDLDVGDNLSGLPWGSLSMSHVVLKGKAKEQSSQQSSRETSVYAAASRTGGSSR
ncbi:hypothetical protein LTR16_003774 [Cryomyces antarcticus]|uniref:BZIP domain-containing protein n=1 Tax=Cryomyces antarcticus TaxID=329879 RepID=A0ABR0M6T5_9PEZI|nr:hypothetical protein LTR16_003774 [Cryomyces antarcticus]